MKEIIKEIYFNDTINIEEEIKKIESEGYRITGAEPIQEIKVKIIGRRFILEKV